MQHSKELTFFQTQSFFGTQDSNFNNIIKFVNSGSMKSIKGSGIYYIANAVTDKPHSSGGMLVLADAQGNGQTMAGLYQPNNSSLSPYRVSVVGGVWAYSS